MREHGHNHVDVESYPCAQIHLVLNFDHISGGVVELSVAHGVLPSVTFFVLHFSHNEAVLTKQAKRFFFRRSVRSAHLTNSLVVGAWW